MKKSRVFGGKCIGLLANSEENQGSLCWRTLQISFDWGDSTFLGPLPKSGMIANGQLSELQILGPITEGPDGSVSRILPTPTAMGELNSKERLERAISLGKQGLPLYTRRVENGRKIEGKRTFGIKEAIIHKIMLPTPTVNEAHNNPTLPSQWKRHDSLNVEMAKKMGFTLETIGKKARLNPHYVQWMMGFPTGWLD